MLSVAIQLAVVHGYGEHKADLSKPQLHKALFWFFIEQIQYKMVICLNKVSVVLLYKRIFITKTFQIVCWIVLGIIISWNVASIAATIFQCVPVEGAWNSTVHGTCIDTSMFWMAYAVIDILTDATVLILPLPEVFKLNLNIRQKISLCGVFLLGSFVTLCSIMRIFAVLKDDKGKDTTWDFVPRNVWSLVETNIGIICACLPVLKSPILRALSFLTGATQRSTRIPRASAYELREESRQKASEKDRSRTTTRRSGRTPWDDVSHDGASDEVHIIAGSVGKDTSGHELDFGFGKNQIHVKRDVEIVQNEV